MVITIIVIIHSGE